LKEINRLSRQVLIKTKDIVQALEFELLYADTDSVFLKKDGAGGATYTTGSGEFASGGIGSSAAGTAAFTFQGIGHYGADGKIRDIGIVIFNGKGNGNLAFAGNAYGVYKDEIDKAGML
jgi:hypothetical protein